MKVLFTTNLPSPYRVDFFRALGEKCELTVLFERRTAANRDERWAKEEFGGFRAVFLPGISLGEETAFCPAVLKYVGDKSFDRIIIGMYSSPTSLFAIEFMRMRRIPFLLNADGGTVREENTLKYRFKRHFIGAARQWLSTGRLTDDYFLHYGARRDGILFYPFTSLKEEDFARARALRDVPRETLREKLGMTEKRIVLSVGRFSYEAGYGKGYDAVMRAAERMGPETGFYLVGDEPTQEFLDWKETHGLGHVHFLPFKEKVQLGEYYAAADVFVLMTKYDVWGLVINEAMMYGLPVVTTNRCMAGCELVKDGENGYLLEVGDDRGLQERLTAMLGDGNLLRRFGEKSRKRIAGYTVERMAEIVYGYLAAGETLPGAGNDAGQSNEG